MKLRASMGRQVGDLLAYILLPLSCLVLPFRPGQALIARLADRGWLLRARSQAALDAASRYVPVTDPQDWSRRWRLTELCEARDLWFALLGRGGALARRVRVDGMPTASPGRVLVGMHWGPSLLALRLFRDAGLAPRFVYRPPGRDVLRAGPFQYLYLHLLTTYIRRSCNRRDIRVPGARQRLRDALGEPGTPVVLLDAPVTTRGQSVSGGVGGWLVELSRDGAETLAAAGASCTFYALGTDPDGLPTLRCAEAIRPDSADDLIAAYCDFLAAHLDRDSAQWRLWPAADQFFRQPLPGAAGVGNPATGPGPQGDARHGLAARAG